MGLGLGRKWESIERQTNILFVLVVSNCKLLKTTVPNAVVELNEINHLCYFSLISAAIMSLKDIIILCCS